MGIQKHIGQTENANIEVLGTAFNAKNRREKIQVVSSFGKIKLKKFLMEAEDLAALSQGNF